MSARSAVPTVMVGGSVAQRPGSGGHTWVFLQYLLGFRRLGWDVLLLDRLEPDMCVDAAGRPVRARAVGQPRLPRRGAASASASATRYALLLRRRRALARAERASRSTARGREAALMLNVNGFVDDAGGAGGVPAARLPRHRPRLRADVARARPARPVSRARRVRHDRRAHRPPGLHDPDRAASTGSRRRSRSCSTQWPVAGRPRRRRVHERRRAGAGRSAPIEYEGETYGLRVHEFRRFAELPRRSPETLRGRARHRRGRGRRTSSCCARTAGGWRTPRVEAARSVGLPRLRAGLEGRS